MYSYIPEGCDLPVYYCIDSTPINELVEYTTVERNALSPQNGDAVFDTTENKAYQYQQNAWVEILPNQCNLCE
jgi:hypothetical protein